ncbi:MAG: hypothetical protein QW101_03930 [Ignisphaera sp.]|uniref:Uncharacterized protein n=1 Tax=Ignisphaera aggregans TaxID=334771 RepID=A0A7J3MXL0_9CREN
MPLLERMSRSVEVRIEKAASEERDKRYINTLSEIQSFIKQVREFMNALRNLETMYTDLTHGRICFRWIYTEYGSNISLVKLEPRLTILYTHDKLQTLYISFDDRSVILYEGLKIGFTVNTYSEVVDLNDEENVISKRSLILDAVSRVGENLTRSIANINLCIKYARYK